MKLIIALSLLAVAGAAPTTSVVKYSPNNVQLLSFETENIGLPNYRFSYGQSDGQAQQAQGEIKNEGREDESYAVTGSFTWVGPDGVTYFVRYTADENGYQPIIEQGPGGAVSPSLVAALVG